MSDKHLTENSGLLNHLLPGDTILDNQEFDIQDSVSMYTVLKLQCLPSQKGRSN